MLAQGMQDIEHRTHDPRYMIQNKHSLYMYRYIHTSYTHTDIHTYIHTYRYTYIQTDIHTYIHTFIHTYKHRYIHTFCVSLWGLVEQRMILDHKTLLTLIDIL